MENNNLGKHQSIFEVDSIETSYPILNEDAHTDIAIIGGGIVGLTLAYLLRNSNQKVTLFEANHIAMGMSLRTTAKLTIAHHLIYDRLMHTKSPDKAKQYAAINQQALEFVRSTIEKERIACDFRKSPSYIYTIQENNIYKIKDEFESYRYLGLNVNYVESIPLNLPIKAALEYEESYLFHVRKYLLHLANAFVEAGGTIYEQTPIQAIEPEEKVALETRNGFFVQAKKIIIASHFPMYDGLGFYFTRLIMKRDYVIGIKVPKEKQPEGNYISVDHPRFSVRPVPEKDVVLIAGGEHRTGDSDNELGHYEQLKEFASQVFNTNEILYHWSAQDYVTSDGVPYVGYLNKKRSHDIYVATGFNKWGMTGGTSAALVLYDMLTLGKSPYEELLNPNRGDAFWGQDFLKHNFEEISNYIRGKLRQVPKEELPQRGEAIVTRLQDGNVYGVYLDEEEQYHIVDITCPHVGATLRWNSSEKSWDCPVHGSRFSVDGEVLEGPSTHSLNHFREGKNLIYPNIY